MGNIVQLIPHYTQPQHAVKIDRSTPAGRAITYCLPLNGENRDIVTGAQLSFGSAASTTVDPRGKSLKSAGGASCASIPLDLSAYTKVSVSFWMYWDAFANNDALAMEYGPLFYDTIPGFLVDPNSAGGAFEVGVGGGGVTNDQTFTRPSAAAWHHYVINFDRTTGTADACSAFVDGVPQVMADAGTQSDVSDNFANSTLYIFSRNNASLFGAGRMQNLVIRGQYLMSASEAKAEYGNPWQIFQPQEVPIWFADAGVSLVAADIAHGHALDAVTLTQVHNLAQADIAHGHSLDAVTLTQAHSIALADVAHGHTVEDVVLNTDATLAVADVSHGHTVESVTLTQVHNLAQADVSHGHVVEAVSITQAHNLVQADVTHAHTLDAVTLVVGAVTLSLDIVLHAHTLDSVNLTQAHNLSLANVAHAHTLGAVIFTFDGIQLSAPRGMYGNNQAARRSNTQTARRP